MLVLEYQSWYMGTDRRWAALVWTVNVAKLLAVSVARLLAVSFAKLLAVSFAKLLAVTVAKLLALSVLSGGPTGRSWCAAVALKGRVLVIGGEQSDCEKVHSR